MIAPYLKINTLINVFPSRAVHVKFRLNPPGPPGKAKYSYMTNSEKYREGKVKSTPGGE